MRSDGYVRAILTVIAAALVVLVAIEGGWLPVGRTGTGEGSTVQKGRWQWSPLRFGPLGNFVVRFDTATGKLERVRFPASNVVWEEIGVVPEGQPSAPDPLHMNLPRPQTGAAPGAAPPAGEAP
jgi:hypothetical protein